MVTNYLEYIPEIKLGDYSVVDYDFLSEMCIHSIQFNKSNFIVPNLAGLSSGARQSISLFNRGMGVDMVPGKKIAEDVCLC